jgi:hypothetical protein
LRVGGAGDTLAPGVVAQNFKCDQALLIPRRNTFWEGAEIGDSVSNGRSVNLKLDAVRTAEVHTGRFGAEYAHPGAAILDFDAPEGDDRWRYTITDFIPGLNVQYGLQLEITIRVFFRTDRQRQSVAVPLFGAAYVCEGRGAVW